MSLRCISLTAGSCFVVALLCGCDGRDEIKTYRIAKAPAENPHRAEMPAMPETPPSGGLPHGIPPPAAATVVDTPAPGWEAQPLSSMRQASYQAKGDKDARADISLVILAGTAGGPLDNVNRWLTQLGAEPITEEQLASLTRHVASPLGDVLLVDLPPPSGEAKDAGGDRILAGQVTHEGRTFFFKLRAPSGLAEAQKENFTRWVASVKPATGGAAAEAVPSVPPPAEGKPRIQWTPPAHWKPEPAKSMRYATFSVPGAAGETADVSVVVLPGASGGDLDNVNRWRSQAGLEPVDAAGLKKIVVPVRAGNAEILTVDLGGPKQHIVAGWALVDGNTWFFKIAGPEAPVAAEKNNFLKFLQSVQF